MLTPAQRELAKAMTEAELLAAIIDAAHTFGWLVHHCRPAQRADGKWMTPIQGHAGFPDAVLTRRGRLVFVEAKREKGELTPDQQMWFDALSHVPHHRPDSVSEPWVQVFVWRPSDWLSGEIETVLR